MKYLAYNILGKSTRHGFNVERSNNGGISSPDVLIGNGRSKCKLHSTICAMVHCVSGWKSYAAATITGWKHLST